MSITECDQQADDWMSLNVDSDLQPESEKDLDSENREFLSESAHFDFMSQAEKGDGVDLLSECRREEYKHGLEKGDYKPESEKTDFRTESEESDLESDKSQTGSEVFDRLKDIQATGLMDRATESDIPFHDESPETNKIVRRLRCVQDTGATVTARNASPGEPQHSQNNAAVSQTEDKVSEPQTLSSLAPSNRLDPPATATRNWVRYLAPKTICLVVMSLIYLGFSLFGIKMWSSSTDDV